MAFTFIDKKLHLVKQEHVLTNFVTNRQDTKTRSPGGEGHIFFSVMATSHRGNSAIYNPIRCVSIHALFIECPVSIKSLYLPSDLLQNVFSLQTTDVVRHCIINAVLPDLFCQPLYHSFIIFPQVCLLCELLL